MNSEVKTEISKILLKSVDRALARSTSQAEQKPFHEALLPGRIMFFSAFERSFSTSFGQKIVEEISKLIARDNGFEVERHKETMVNIFKGARDEISVILQMLRNGERKPNWNQEVQKISAYSKGDTVAFKVISDLWLKKNNIEYFISIKTTKPNLDQVEIAKKDMLFLKANSSSCVPLLAFYYNPYGNKKSDYAWTIPDKIFDMRNDESIMIGKEYWDFLGGNGTYEELIEVFQSIGVEVQKKLDFFK